MQSVAATREQAISGVTSGLIAQGQEVEWRAKHFGFWFKMRVQITGFRPPLYFQDSMIEGPFQSFTHDHNFEAQNSTTLMTDRIIFASPVPVARNMLDGFILRPYLRRFVGNRNVQLKTALESNL